MVAVCLAILLQVGSAQKSGTPADADHTRKVLVANAHALEARGRPDMAIQLWQQILLSDPNNTEALAGLAKDYKLSGSVKESDQALERLRNINPNDPAITQVEGLSTGHVQSDQLRRAGDLARQGKNDEAMNIYRQLYGDRPPEGDVGLAYYQTLYGSAGGKEKAIAGMRGLVQRNPADTRYAVTLGRMLTYDQRTRAEGIHILEQHPLDPDARDALRQALIWNSANPASAPELRAYLRAHPEDREIAGHLREDEAKLARMNTGIARTPDERAAYTALNAKRLDEAEKLFTAILQENPNDGPAAAGMGFLRMQQQNFGGAISYLTQAEQNGTKTSAVENALAASRFWFTMGEASQAFDANQYDVAAQKYRDALAMRPKSTEALNGLAGLLLKEQQYQQAADVYSELLKAQPADADAWRGLFISYARDGQDKKALDVARRFPPRVRAAMDHDPEYLRTLSAIYQSGGRAADAQKALAKALALPFPDNGMKLKEDTRLQYAGILMAANRFSQAAELYTQILSDDPSNISAWMGLVSAHHQLGQDTKALADVERMPPATYETALSDANFLSMLGSIYQQANQVEVAQSLLERSVRLQTAAGSQPSLQLQMQLAGIYLQRGDTDKAYPIYRQILSTHPDRLDAWKGLIAILQATNHTGEALEQLGYIPPDVRKQLETDPEFVETEASIYASAGNTKEAVAYMARVQRYYEQQHLPMPSNLAIQNAWLLYNTQNDRALYPALMQLGSRPDLTPGQRETVQTIWANWAVRRAGTAIDNNDNERAVEILEASMQAFPDNLQVKWVLAGGYMRTGQSRLALALYKRLPLQDASSDQFQGAIGSALAANDHTTAEAWLRLALQRYPHDYHILVLAARFEQVRGDNERAADYWRAALNAMPANSPTDRLAHDLAYPDQDNSPHKATNAGDLQQLLNPDYVSSTQRFSKTVKLPPLPAYGPDPYSGHAPVSITSSPTAQLSVEPQVPATTQIPVQQIDTPAATPPTRSSPVTTVPQASSPTPDSSASPAASQSGGKTSPAHRARRTNHTQQSTAPAGFSGQVHLSPSEEFVTTTDASAPSAHSASAASAQPVYIPPPPAKDAAPRRSTPLMLQPQTPQAHDAPQIYIPEPQASSQSPQPPVHPALRLSSEPVGGQAAAVQAQFAQQDTDTQLTQGDTQIRQLQNVPVLGPGQPAAPAVASVGPILNGTTPILNNAQYTPSAQDAATGAYSAQRPPSGQAAPTQANPAQSCTNGCAPPPPPARHHRRKKSAENEPATETVPTLSTAPSEQYPAQPPAQETQPPAAGQQAPAESNPGGLTDEQLQERNLPPLRGPWVRVQREPRSISPREEAEQQLTALESGYSGWLGGAGIVNYRSGSPGYDRLTALEAPFEASAPLGYHSRFTFVGKPVFLDSGQADGSSTITVQEFTAGGRTLVAIPQPLGTDTNTGVSGTSAAQFSPPPQQNAAGIALEGQFITPQFAVAFGYTPLNFLVANWTARAYFRPGNGAFTFAFTRDSIKDSQLSYSGLRDPGTASLSFPGVVWGGVMANQGNIQIAHGDALSGFYVGAGGQYIQGYNVKSNFRIDGNGGAYWRIRAYPEYGNLSIGANFFGMHYDNNQDAFTFGMGGYFSPQFYFLANVPVTWEGHYQTRWHYEVVGGIGIQAFQQDATPLFPLANQKAIEIALSNAVLPALTSVGPNYNFRGNLAYQIGPHWFAGAFMQANNSRNYNSFSAGFSIHYMFRAQPSAVSAPTGLFPTDGLRPFTVP